MAENTFSIGEAISYGWSKVKEKFWFWAAISATVMLISGIGSELAKSFGEGSGAALVVNVVFMLIGVVLQIGVVVLALKTIDNKPLDYSELFTNGKYFLNYFLASLLVGIITLIGLILLIVPGIIWAIKYQFATYFVIDKNMPIGEAMKKSAEITAGKKLDLFLLGLAFIGVTILGAICLGVGLLWAIPVTWIGLTYVYRKLASVDSKKSSPEKESPTTEPSPQQ